MEINHSLPFLPCTKAMRVGQRITQQAQCTESFSMLPYCGVDWGVQTKLLFCGKKNIFEPVSKEQPARRFVSLVVWFVWQQGRLSVLKIYLWCCQAWNVTVWQLYSVHFSRFPPQRHSDHQAHEAPAERSNRLHSLLCQKRRDLCRSTSFQFVTTNSPHL